MLTTKANKLRKPRPTPRHKLLGGTQLPETRPALKLGGKPVSLPKILALDTETTGRDFYHGCRPFFVSTCDEDGNIRFWEWDVNPFTRNVGQVHPDATHKAIAANVGEELADEVVPEAKYRTYSLEDSPWGDNSFLYRPPTKDLDELAALITGNNFILHNTKFDTRALESLRLPRINLDTVHDTLIASHVLCSNEAHGLKELAMRYLDIPDDDQKELQEAVNTARRWAKNQGWRVADEGDPHFPADKRPDAGWWVMDMWLPRMVAKYRWEVEGDPDFVPPGTIHRSADIVLPNGDLAHTVSEGHPWWTICRKYALRDVERTYGLFWTFMEELDNQGLMHLYEERRKVLSAVYQMEFNGVTINCTRLEERHETLNQEATVAMDKCFELAGRAPHPKVKMKHPRDIQALPAKERAAYLKSVAPIPFENVNSTDQLRHLLYSRWGLSTTKRTKGGKMATDKEVLVKLKDRASGDAKEFITNLLEYRRRNTACRFLKEYHTRGLHEDYDGETEWITLHGNFNPTGTDTTRFSSSTPNLQNISKKEYIDDEGEVIRDLNVRRVFGPQLGREWYSIDYSNIELRIFAYESGDEDLIKAFETGYSVHLLFAEILYTNEWAKCRARVLDTSPKEKHRLAGDMLREAIGDLFKSEYESTWYQWCKNGNFSLIYGAGRAKADATYHKSGAYDTIRAKMPLIDAFLYNKQQEAQVHGYITCLGGYRLYVPLQEPHKAVNYFVQGTAGWFMVLAINRVHDYITNLNNQLYGPNGNNHVDAYRMTMVIHDELDFDFPKHPRNKKVIADIAALMEMSGKPYGIPTPVGIELHTDNWADSEKLKLQSLAV